MALNACTEPGLSPEDLVRRPKPVSWSGEHSHLGCAQSETMWCARCHSDQPICMQSSTDGP